MISLSVDGRVTENFGPDFELFMSEVWIMDAKRSSDHFEVCVRYVGGIVAKKLNKQCNETN